MFSVCFSTKQPSWVSAFQWNACVFCMLCDIDLIALIHAFCQQPLCRHSPLPTTAGWGACAHAGECRGKVVGCDSRQQVTRRLQNHLCPVCLHLSTMQAGRSSHMTLPSMSVLVHTVLGAGACFGGLGRGHRLRVVRAHASIFTHQ